MAIPTRDPVSAQDTVLSPVIAMMRTSIAIMPPLLPASARVLEAFSATIEHISHPSQTTRRHQNSLQLPGHSLLGDGVVPRRVHVALFPSSSFFDDPVDDVIKP
ncbi:MULTISPECIES: hypothetical protein [unclassified Streptomyces]|uniref:hypothetical protein n=1 Tax=unclassified Streptomyces TaxID=2593676 RepID=UPI002F9104D2